MKNKDRDYFQNKEHYKRILNDREYFLYSFDNLLYHELDKDKYDIANEEEKNDIISEGFTILLELYDRAQQWFSEGKYHNKGTFDKIKILQSFIKKAFPGRLFNYWIKWRTLKYVQKEQSEGRNDYRRCVYPNQYYELYDEASIANYKNDMYPHLVNTYGDDIENKIIDKIDRNIQWEHIKDFVYTRKNGITYYKIYEMYHRYNYPAQEIADKFGLSKKRVRIIIWYLNNKLRNYYN